MTEKKYYLRPSNEKVKKVNIIGFDIETHGDYNNFLMGSLVDDNLKKIFWDKKKLQQFIFNNKFVRNSKVYATNLGFDFLGTFGDKLEKFDNYILRGSDFITLRYDKNYVNFFDSLNYYRASVQRLGDVIEYPKLEKPEFLGKEVMRNTKDGDYLERYNIRDSEVTFKFMKFLEESFNKMGCNLKYTIASTSMSLFKNKYLKHWIQQPSKEVIEEMFNGYYGGRVEAFYRGLIPKKQYKYFDINSLYPATMKYRPFPNPNTMKIGVDLKKEGLTYCEIDCFKPKGILAKYPLLPCRTDTKLLFPLGIFKGWHSNVELRKAIELGYNVKPIKGYYYERNFNPFEDFVTDLYEKRLYYKKLGNPIELAMKICLNSLYGKFCQRLHKQEILFMKNKNHYEKYIELIKENRRLAKLGLEERYKLDCPIKNEYQIDGDNNTYYFDTDMFYYTDMNVTKFPKFINPILGIYITSYARLELYKWIEYIYNEGGIVLYCDTDSIITDMELPVSSDLGDMKKELDIYQGLIIKPKFYYLEDIKGNELVKSKGLHNLKSYIQFDKILQTQEYKYMKFTKFKESLRRNMVFNQKIDVTKFVELEDDKREWSKPFNRKELQESKPRKIMVLE